MSSSGAATSAGGGGGHILVIPFPAQGHMLPLLHLSHQLTLRGLTLTLLVTPQNLPLLSPLLSAHPTTTIRTLVLPFPSQSSLPPAVEHVSQIGNSGAVSVIAALSSLSDPISRSFSSHPFDAILSDFFLGWTVPLAQKLSVPRIAFFSSGPFFASIIDRLWRFHNSPESRSLPLISFPDLPRSPSFPRHHLPSSFLRYDQSNPDWEIVRAGMLANASSWGCVFNTFDAMEGEYLERLKEEKYGHGRIYGVGPISLLGGPKSDSNQRVDPNPEKTEAVMRWLDGCGDEGSVLYVCFGSQKLLKKEQMEALASALDRSGVRFVWAVKKPSTAQQGEDGYGSVPEGFEERVRGRGVVLTGWAPQVEILSHGAVGWFLSHCGWNSVLEGLGAGVVILGWPMEAEQYLNARLLVEELGVAARVWEGADSVPDPAELGRRIADSTRGTHGVAARAKEMREEALRAAGSGGSSTRDLDGLVTDLLGHLKLKQGGTRSSSSF